MTLSWMNTLNSIEAVIPKAREARARFLQRASRAEESAPLQFGREMRPVPHPQDFYALYVELHRFTRTSFRNILSM
jgi:hypothetical protein